MLALVLQSAAPAQPEGVGILERLPGIDGIGVGQIGGTVSEREPDTLTVAHREIGYGLQILAVDWNGGTQNRQIGAGDGAHAVIDARHPWDGAAVIEAQCQFHAQIQFASDAFDQTHDVGELFADRHEVDEPDGSVGVLEGGFENQGVAAIAARCLLPFTMARGDSPIAVLLGSQQGGETCL